jgi:DegV family protein with EDD domain
MAYMPTASKTAFVADTTLGLSPEEALEKGIHLVPVQVIHGGRSYRDLLEIGPEEVLALLEKGERLSTSQAAPEDLRATYERLLLDHDRVLSVHLSGKLSGTVATGQAVARAYGGRVQVLDSWSLNGGLWLVLEEARRLLKEGVAWEALEEAVAAYRKRVLGYVLPKTLTYLHRSGRIGGIARFVGGSCASSPSSWCGKGRWRPDPGCGALWRECTRWPNFSEKISPKGPWSTWPTPGTRRGPGR